jgi:hypothetical protein
MQSNAPRRRNSVVVDRLKSSVMTIMGMGESLILSQNASCSANEE